MPQKSTKGGNDLQNTFCAFLWPDLLNERLKAIIPSD